MTDTPMKTHSLRRTSPKGQPFLGTCVLCGRTDLPMTAVHDYCENLRGTDEKTAVIEAITGGPRDD